MVNSAEVPTAEFTRNPRLAVPGRATCSARSPRRRRRAHAEFVDATRLATALLGDAIATNMFMLGYAWQKGLVPVSAAAIERAIELNGVAVEVNQQGVPLGPPRRARPRARSSGSPRRPK